jgi:helicase
MVRKLMDIPVPLQNDVPADPWATMRRCSMIVPLVQQLVAAGEKVIVFRNARGPAAGCAAYLAAELGLPAAQEALDLLPQLDRSSTSQKLARCLQGGTAFHTSDLKREERALIETAFRDPNGPVKVLVATSTVAAGVNTPASTVIIVETEFFEAEGRKPYTVAQYKNMAGRAGRLGYETQGKAIMLAENSIDQNRLFRTYVSGTPEAIASSFDPNNPGTWLIRLLAQVVRVTRTQAADLLANTYGGYLKNLAQPGWQVQFQRQIAALLSRMEHDGLIEAEGTDHIRLTILGNACGQSPLALESAMQLVEMLRQIAPGDLTPASLMAIVQGLPEQDDDYTPMGRGRAEANRPTEASRRFGGLIVRLLQRLAGTDAKYNARCKRALILADWIDGVPLEEIERRYTANAFSAVGHGDIRGFADATRFYLGSASRIAAIIHAEADTLHDGVETLLKQLDIGLPAAALELTDLPVNLTRGEYLALYTRGLRTIGEIRSADLPLLTEILGRRRAMEISAVLAPPAAVVAGGSGSP